MLQVICRACRGDSLKQTFEMLPLHN